MRFFSADASPSLSKNSGSPSARTWTIASSSRLPSSNGLPLRRQHVAQRLLVLWAEARQGPLDSVCPEVLLDEGQPRLEDGPLDLLHTSYGTAAPERGKGRCEGLMSYYRRSGNPESSGRR